MLLQWHGGVLAAELDAPFPLRRALFLSAAVVVLGAAFLRQQQLGGIHYIGAADLDAPSLLRCTFSHTHVGVVGAFLHWRHVRILRFDDVFLLLPPSPPLLLLAFFLLVVGNAATVAAVVAADIAIVVAADIANAVDNVAATVVVAIHGTHAASLPGGARLLDADVLPHRPAPSFVVPAAVVARTTGFVRIDAVFLRLVFVLVPASIVSGHCDDSRWNLVADDFYRRHHYYLMVPEMVGVVVLVLEVLHHIGVADRGSLVPEMRGLFFEIVQWRSPFRLDSCPGDTHEPTFCRPS